MTSMEEIRLIDTAHSIAAASCMRALGFKDWSEKTIVHAGPDTYKDKDLFEYLDPKQAVSSGYPRSEPDLESLSLNSGEQKRKLPSQEEMAAYDGTTNRTTAGKDIPQGGCAKESDRKVYKTTTDLPVDSRSLAVDSRVFTMTDSRMKQVLASWRSCMVKNGLGEYESPLVIPHDSRWKSRGANTPAGDEEKHVAGVDANCQQEVNLVGFYKALRFAYEERLVTENKNKLIAAKPIFRGWVKNAQSIISGN
ncbi:hypothetical protein HS048_34875 [Planomonospora sp. ID91781]|uniref:hypothetical protein n=1 Tax=Planomonospora sp. ID91781 TaxID=2738135 RepID=UPI0018C3FD47|nr:hypothetical protein [Planomonospora sp. ID91781]MBG0825868.1 hypothetical protein [Planomonospora sp. ID91781]